MNIKLLNEHNLELLSLKEGFTDWSESIHVKMPHCWKSHVAAQIVYAVINDLTGIQCFVISLYHRNYLAPEPSKTYVQDEVVLCFPFFPAFSFIY